MPRRRTLAVTALTVLALAAPAVAATEPLAARLDRALTVPGVSWRATAAFTLDLRTGGVVYARNAGLSLRPASNEKLAVAAAALDELGPTSRIPTRVLGNGERDRSVWRGSLVLKGYGDPTLSWGDLAVLARRVEGAGIRRITGSIVADESYFDDRRTVAGWRPSFYKKECPPLSALVVSRARVAGRTVDDPALAAAQAFRRALAAEGIAVAGAAGKGAAATGAPRVASVWSSSMALIVARMNRVSDNFTAEMLLKLLGRAEVNRGTSPAGAAVVRRELAERGVPLAGVRIVDGSGLSRYDRLTARAIGALLVSVWSDVAIQQPFFSSLPVAGVSGTLEDRLERPPARGRVRAKTGTTSRASALSGYVGRRYVFSILQNGDPIPSRSARAGQDRFAQIIAAQP